MKHKSIQSSLIQFFLALIAIPLLYVSVFVLLAVVALTLPYRLFVYIIAKNFGSNIVGFIYGLSGLTATDPLHTASTLNIILLLVLDDVIPIQRFQKIFRDRIINKRDPITRELVYGRLQQYWVNFLGYNMWKRDPEFCIENHIRPSLECYTRKDLPQLINDLLAQPFKRDRSPWEITLIDNYKDSREDKAGVQKNKMVIAIKIHHTLADGFSLAKMIKRDLSAGYQTPIVPKPSSVEQSWWKMVARLHLFAYDFMNTYIDSYDPKNTWIFPLNSAQNPATQKYYTSITSDISVSDVSAVRHKYNVSYLTVLVHCILKGVRQAMEKEAQGVPEKILYKFTRAKANHPEGLVNHVYVTAVTLSMQKTSTKCSLQNIEAEMKKERMSVKPIGFSIVTSILVFLPAFLVRFVVLYLVPPGFTCSVVPVLKDVTSFEGAKVTDLFVSLGPMAPQRTLMITAFGDGGKQSIVLSTDQSNYSSQEAFAKLGDYIKDEFNTLVKSLQDK